MHLAHDPDAVARAERVDFAIPMDMSGACGSQVIPLGSRFMEERVYQRGRGVAAAALERPWYREYFGA